MLYSAIGNIQRILNDDLSATVSIANIAMLDIADNDQNDADIIISLVNIEETRLARNQQYVVEVDGNLLAKNPPIHLNLSLLFTAHGTGYANNLQNLQEVIAFFQKYPTFTAADIPGLAEDRIERLTIEMVTLSLEQLQQLWSMLGGKYRPSVLYKMRMLTIDSILDNPVPPVRHIQAQFKQKNR
ncbi:DUF4255 domain-containing protein [Parapedobacter soli]|uniref:DUF4255 domain-containing protein n=1 Tax=Parapedobacter soli TaxID=416955 RepID=UPI0021C58926|nr:DUF4255 domain-containing protein [Parapedobacter soli]